MNAGGDDESARRLAQIRRAVEDAPEVQPEPPDSEIYAPEPAGGEGRRTVHLRVVGGDAATDAARSPRPEGSEAGLVLDVRAPFDAVERLVERDRTVGGMAALHYWRGTWLCWNGRSSYEILSEQALRQWLYKSLAASYQADKGCLERVKPKRNMINDFVDALRAACALDDRIEPPAWLGPVEDRPPAGEFAVARNGVVHLPSQELWPPDPSYFALGAAGIDFDPEAPEPVEWLAFLRSLWPDDQASIDCLQEWFGYLISAETAQQKILFLHGVSRSGKGTIGRVLRALLGPGQVAPAGMGDFGTRFGLESLVGKSVAIVPDARLSRRTDQAPIVEKMLSISGEDAITIDRKYAAPWCGRLNTRLVLLSNEIPKLRDAACALPNRFVVLKLTESFLGREDLGLGGRLSGELAEIFNWGLDGLDRLRVRGRFVQPESAMDLIRTMIGLASSVAAFLDERCIRSSSLEIEKDRLHRAYSEWCVDRGQAAMTKTGLSQGLQTLGVGTGQSRSLGRILGDRLRPWVYKGVDLREP